MSIKTPGLLLQSIPYLGQKKILKIFTPDHGLISLFATNTKFAPFCLAEWVYRKTNKEIHTLQDATLLDPLLELRENYDSLIAAGAIAQDLIRTQMSDKQSPDLFSLSSLYFKNLPKNPPIFAASFRLKVLLHEGLLSHEIDPSFTEPEWEQVLTLAFSRKLSLIQQQLTAPTKKIELLFNERFGLKNL